MKRAALVAAFLAACATATAPPPTPPVDEQTRNTIAQLEQLLAKHPHHLPYTYILATFYDRAHDAENVVKWLTRLDELGWEQGVAPDAFRNTNTRAFRAIAAKLDARMPRVSRATTAFTLRNRRDLVPEGIAYDPVEDVFYVSGIYRRNVLRVDRAGRATDFVGEGADGMLGGLGVKVDRERRLLWVVSSVTPEMRGYTSGTDRSLVAIYSLPEGKLVRKIEVPGGFLNDLALFRDGSALITDTKRHKVVRLAAGAETLEDWGADFRFPNGIALSDDERALYVADFRGVHRIDVADKTRTAIESKTLLGGIDGLSFHDGALIGIQNAVGRPRVVRIHPGDGSVEILESGNPLFEVPTTGAIAGNDYYFIANPGLRSFDTDQTIWPVEKLEDPVMLRIALR